MQHGSILVRNLTIFLLVCLTIVFANKVYAFDEWYGVMDSNVNMRKTPRLKGEKITRLNKGDRVLVKDEDEGWLQVILQEESSGDTGASADHSGWVYGKYVKKTGNVEKRALSLLEEKAADQAEKFKSSEEKIPEVLKKTVQLPDEDSKKGARTGIEKNVEMENSVDVEKRSTISNPSPVEKKHPEKISGSGKIITLFLRVSTVLLSCLALLLAYKAMKIAEKSRKETMLMRRMIEKRS